MPREINFWDVLFHLGMLILAIWTILKSIGYINTPVWIEYGIPISGLIFSFFAFYHNISGTIFNLKDELTAVKIEIAKMNVKLENHDNELAKIHLKLDHHDKDLESIHKDMGFIKHKIC